MHTLTPCSVQGDFPAAKMVDGLHGVDPARKARLLEVLDVDPTWRMHLVSDGQRRRVQLLLGLLHPFKVPPRTDSQVVEVLLEVYALGCRPLQPSHLLASTLCGRRRRVQLLPGLTVGLHKGVWGGGCCWADRCSLMSPLVVALRGRCQRLVCMASAGACSCSWGVCTPSRFPP